MQVIQVDGRVLPPSLPTLPTDLHRNDIIITKYPYTPFYNVSLHNMQHRVLDGMAH